MSKIVVPKILELGTIPQIRPSKDMTILLVKVHILIKILAGLTAQDEV